MDTVAGGRKDADTAVNFWLLPITVLLQVECFAGVSGNTGLRKKTIRYVLPAT